MGPLIWMTACLALLLASGCGDDECRERVDPLDREEKQREQITELLDEAGVTASTRGQILTMHTKLGAERSKVREHQEKHMTSVLHELLQLEPDRSRAQSHVASLAAHVTAYAHTAVDHALRAHALLTAAQRDAIGDEVEDAKGSFPSDFMINRGVDYALYQVDASGPQKVRILELKDALMSDFGKLRVKQGRERRFLIGQWRAASPDAPGIHESIDRASAQLVGFGQRAVGGFIDAVSVLQPKQRTWIDGRIRGLKTCPAQG